MAVRQANNETPVLVESVWEPPQHRASTLVAPQSGGSPELPRSRSKRKELFPVAKTACVCAGQEECQFNMSVLWPSSPWFCCTIKCFCASARLRHVVWPEHIKICQSWQGLSMSVAQVCPSSTSYTGFPAPYQVPPPAPPSSPRGAQACCPGMSSNAVATQLSDTTLASFALFPF
jgi:hypothetical protein